jgi:hypothetical protein
MQQLPGIIYDMLLMCVEQQLRHCCNTGSVNPGLPGQSSIHTSFRTASKGYELRASLGIWKSQKGSAQKE